MSKFLVTGGAGFIGSNIARKLVEYNQEVRILDNFSTGRKSNLDDFISKVEVIEGDLADIESCKKAVSGADFVLHHGAIPSVQRSVDDPIKTNQANILGTLNLLTASRDFQIKKFIYAASSSAYGDSEVMPKVETMTTAPKSPYAVQKLTGEYYCKVFNKIYNVPTVALRYFNVFGPYQDPDSTYSAVIPLFIKKMLKGESPIIYGDGDTSRDFTFIDNNIYANIKACFSENKASEGEVINIATGVEISLNQLVEKINKILATNIKPEYKEERKGDVKRSLADISKAKKLIDYEPIVLFDEGLLKTIEFYKKNLTL